jgi:hypothetical protein
VSNSDSTSVESNATVRRQHPTTVEEVSVPGGTSTSVTWIEKVELSRSRASTQRTIGPTASSKLMMGLSPRTFPAWDATMARERYRDVGRVGYRDHLTLTRGRAQQLDDGVADLVDDENGITVAKLLDEWLYEHYVRKVPLLGA